MGNNSKNRIDRVLASLTPDTLNTLAELIMTKLDARNAESLLPKEDVTGSNPATRST
jgi:hypothetical protein